MLTFCAASPLKLYDLCILLKARKQIKKHGNNQQTFLMLEYIQADS